MGTPVPTDGHERLPEISYTFRVLDRSRADEAWSVTNVRTTGPPEE